VVHDEQSQVLTSPKGRLYGKAGRLYHGKRVSVVPNGGARHSSRVDALGGLLRRYCYSCRFGVVLAIISAQNNTVLNETVNFVRGQQYQ
jgi:hypothetical protein